jgi:integrase
MVSIVPENGLTERDIMIMAASDALEDSDFYGRGTVLNRTRDIMLEMLGDYVDRRMQAVFQPEALDLKMSAGIAPTAAQGPIPVGAKLSTFISRWQTDIIQGYNQALGLKPETTDQYLKTVELFVGLMGDLPIGKITKDIAEDFRKQILALPATHGKGRTGSIQKELALAKKKTGVPTVTMKTAKRHFAGMNSIWKWLVHRKHTSDMVNPFSGHSFPGANSGRSARDDWSTEDLQLLFSSTPYREAAKDSALRWLPLISLHSGLRLEEICRLRPDEDIIVRNGVDCFDIRARAGWDPKTEAGNRLVPIHSWLLQHGIRELVNRRRAENADYLFPEFELVRGKLSSGFSREFSRLKTSLQIGRKTAFHSFRHSFRTVLESTELKETHIDAVMGHEGGKSEGRTYTKRVTTAKLKEVVESFSSPLDLSFIGGGTVGTILPVKKKPLVQKRKLIPPSFDENGKLIRQTETRKR